MRRRVCVDRMCVCNSRVCVWREAVPFKKVCIRKKCVLLSKVCVRNRRVCVLGVCVRNRRVCVVRACVCVVRATRLPSIAIRPWGLGGNGGQERGKRMQTKERKKRILERKHNGEDRG